MRAPEARAEVPGGPFRLDVAGSSARVRRVRERIDAGATQPGTTLAATLTLESSSTDASEARLLSPGISVSATTGAVGMAQGLGGSRHRRGDLRRADVAVHAGVVSALTLPDTAVVLRDDFAYAYRPEPGDPATVSRQRVTIGRRGTRSMTFSAWSIGNPVPPILAFLLLTITGLDQLDAVTTTIVDGPVTVLVVFRPDRLDAAELSRLIDDDVERALMEVDGLGKLDRLGGIDRESQVLPNADLLAEPGLSAVDATRQLEQVRADMSGGRGRIGGVRLDEAGEVVDTHADVTSRACLNGEPATAAQVIRLTGSSDIAMTEAVRVALADDAAARPDIRIEEVACNTILPVRTTFHASMDRLCEGAEIAVLVVFLFLRSCRATLLAAVALPISIIPTFLVIDLLGYTLNSVTLLALSPVVGILVDDAIVEVENIERRKRTGKTAYVASMEAANEIDVVRCLLVARLITPMMAAHLLTSPGPAGGARDGWVMRAYLGGGAGRVAKPLARGARSCRVFHPDIRAARPASDRRLSGVGQRPDPDPDHHAVRVDDRRDRQGRAEGRAAAAGACRGSPR